MGRPAGHIRILMSSRVLFDLEEADRIYKEQGLEEYIGYMRAEGKYKDDFDPEVSGRRLKKGPMWNFAKAALELNKITGEPVVEIGFICKDTADTALPVFRNLDVNGLNKVGFRIALAGHKTHRSDLEAFEADLLLTRNPKDAQMAVDAGIAAATVNFPPDGKSYEAAGFPVKIWVDGDAVAFGDSAEVRYKTNSVEKTIALEGLDYKKPLGAGPFTKVLAKISELNAGFKRKQQPFEISLLTSRGAESAARVFNTASELGIRFNGRMYFMDGIAKTQTIKAGKPDIFFDDQPLHLNEAKEFCPTGHVPYKTGSDMFEYLRKVNAIRDTDKESKAGQAFNKSAAQEQDNNKPQSGHKDRRRKPGKGNGKGVSAG